MHAGRIMWKNVGDEFNYFIYIYVYIYNMKNFWWQGKYLLWKYVVLPPALR